MGLYENNSIWDDLKYQFSHGNMVTKLIIANVGIYVIDQLLRLVFFLAQKPVAYEAFLNDWLFAKAYIPNLWKFWTLITYGFFHAGFFHILFNMLWLYWFGRILIEFLGNRKVILPIYVMGAISGALLYIAIYNIFPNVFNLQTSLLGASAGVTAIVLAAATLRPNYTISLLFIGRIPIKYIALFFVISDLITIDDGNPGGHLAHLGGAFFGWFFINQLKRGNDMSIYFNRFVDDIVTLFSSNRRPKVKAKMKTQQRNNRTKKKRFTGFKTRKKAGHTSTEAQPSAAGQKDGNSQQAKIDKILDKIGESGYDTLTKEEKKFLFSIKKDDK